MQPARQGESLEPAEDADTEADGAHLLRIGAGLTSMRSLPELLTLAGSLTSLCLHGNAISRIEGLHQVRGRRLACTASYIASSATTVLLRVQASSQAMRLHGVTLQFGSNICTPVHKRAVQRGSRRRTSWLNSTCRQTQSQRSRAWPG